MILKRVFFLIAISVATSSATAATWTPISKLLPNGAACTATTAYQSRWNSISNKIEVCDGATLTWKDAVAASGSGSGGSPWAYRQIFTSNGTFTVPAGVTKVYVTLIGGGGGGAGGTADPISGGGGGGGFWYVDYPCSVTPGQSLAVTIGAGGSAGAPNSVGGNGGSSIFGACISAQGGYGGGTQGQYGNSNVIYGGDGGSGGGGGYISTNAYPGRGFMGGSGGRYIGGSVVYTSTYDGPCGGVSGSWRVSISPSTPGGGGLGGRGGDSGLFTEGGGGGGGGMICKGTPSNVQAGSGTSYSSYISQGGTGYGAGGGGGGGWGGVQGYAGGAGMSGAVVVEW